MFIVLRDFFYDLNMLINNLLIYDCLLFSCFYLLLKFCKVLDFFFIKFGGVMWSKFKLNKLLFSGKGYSG